MKLLLDLARWALVGAAVWTLVAAVFDSTWSLLFVGETGNSRNWHLEAVLPSPRDDIIATAPHYFD